MRKRGKQYSIGKSLDIFWDVLAILFVFACLFIFYKFIILIIEILTGNKEILDFEFFGILVLLIMFIRLFLSIPISRNIFPKLYLNKKGIWVRVFGLFLGWKFVPWNNITNIKKAPFTYDKWEVWLIGIDSHLIFWHKFISLDHKLGKTPYLFVSDHLENIDEFVLKVAEVTGDDITEELII